MNADLLEALRLEAATRPEAVVDMLIEGGATLTEVLLAYTGNPPEWEDGLPQQCLTEWLARQDPPDGRAEKVSQWRLLEQLHVPNQGLPWEVHLPWDDPGLMRWRTKQAARRYLKRRVLSLFGEVAAIIYLTRQHTAGGRMPDVRREALRAPDWVPPHEEERARDTIDARWNDTPRNIVEDLRAVREAAEWETGLDAPG